MLRTRALPELIDGTGRAITYVRMSLTDRCDLRCRYCMGEDMKFLPRADTLTAVEIVELARHLVARGIKRVRLTGGEPLVRRDVVEIARAIGALLGHGLDELTMTTNATRLVDVAPALKDAGIARINISLDSLDPDRFRQITRHGDLDRVLGGVAAAKTAGMSVKINMVVLNGLNDHEVVPMLRWCADRGFTLSLIETMPLGVIEDDRTDRFLPLTQVKAALEDRFTLVPAVLRTGGPARYWTVAELGVTLGLISPLTNNFCASCNRVRISAAGKLYMCLGYDDHVDLRAALRSPDPGALDHALDHALRLKPARHDFDLIRPATVRHMNATGG